MGLKTDTRFRVRAAAEQIEAGGKRYADITVDDIRAITGTGSRTTINDELKTWKAERDKAVALSSSVPPEVMALATAMWAAAVERGESVFEERRLDMEREVAVMADKLSSAEGERVQALNDLADFRGQLETANTEISNYRELLGREGVAKDNALERVARLEVDLEASRQQLVLDVERERQEGRRLVAEAVAASEARETANRAEINLLGERLEGAQRQFSLQLDEARQIAKRSEGAAQKANERAEELSGQLQVANANAVSHAREIDELKARIVALQTSAASESASLTSQLELARRETREAEQAAAECRGARSVLEIQYKELKEQLTVVLRELDGAKKAKASKVERASKVTEKP